MKITTLAFILLAANAQAADDTNYFKNETIDSCHQKPMSAAVQNCMIYLAQQKQTEYEKSFDALTKKAAEEKDDFLNYSSFLTALQASKKDWDIYIKNECLAQAYLNDKESFAYYTDQNECLIRGYSERIRYYKKYQF